MKRLICIFLITFCFFALVACQTHISSNNANNVEQRSTTKIFVYEGPGFGGGVFAIKIHSDGTFSYQQGAASNYYGTGQWTLKEDVLCIADDINLGCPFINYFKVVEDSLVFLAKDSTNFMYIKLSDGDKFIKAITE